MAGFVDVLLRGLALCGQAVAVGGVVFGLWLLLPALAARPALGALLRRSLATTATGAVVVAVAQALSLGVHIAALAGDAGWPVREIAATTYFHAAVARIAACALLLTGCAVVGRRGPGARWGWLVQAVAVVALGACAAWTSHAAARVGPRALLLTLDALHQLAAGVWIGGLAQLVVLAWGRAAAPWPARLLKRFSATALAAVGVLVAAGVGLALAYVDGAHALFGTSYGLMVLSKGAILAGLVVLGALNFFAVRRLPDAADVGPPRLRRFVEVELGLGATVLFVAASLTSLPPAVDVVTDRASFTDVLRRLTPKTPTLTSPRIADMPVDDPTAPRTDADRACPSSSSGSRRCSSCATTPATGRSARGGSGRACWPPRCCSTGSSSRSSSRSRSSSGRCAPGASPRRAARSSSRSSARSAAACSSRTRTRASTSRTSS